jgi:hypothetical protein
MNNVVLTAEIQCSSWRRAFAGALIRLRPDMNPDTADELADSAYLSLADLDPASAAALCSQGGHVLAARAGGGARQHSLP